tara:strand:- start:284 stop:862 length:579 start_codon:yes stop_codon:yes gene_type:complete
MKYFVGEWETDNIIMESYLREQNFYSGSERKTMLRKGNVKHPKKGQGGSMLYGTTWKGYIGPTQMREKDQKSGLYKTKIYSEHPELMPIFKEYSNIYFPSFKWNQIQMNQNFMCPPHKDGTNIGYSVLCCFGDYTGGSTIVRTDDKDIEYNPREKPLVFNGSIHTHWVAPFEGTRYALVFFCNNYGKKNLCL